MFKKTIILILESIAIVSCNVINLPSTPNPTMVPRTTNTSFPSRTPTKTPTPTITPIPKGNGKLIAFDSGKGQERFIVLVNVDTLRETILTTGLNYRTSAAWSPDGRRLAYNQWKRSDRELYLINVDRTNNIRLDGNCYKPTWSPDGQHIACFSSRAGYWALYTMSPNGAEYKKLTENTVSVSIPTWSPDSQMIAYSTYKGGTYIPNIFAVNIQSESNPSQITDEVNGATNAKWSPDGKQILFTSWQAGIAQIFVMNIDGSGQKQLTSGATPNYDAAWSPDGSKILFVSLRDEPEFDLCLQTNTCNSEIYIMNADGSHQIRLTTNAAPDWHPIWSPEGTLIAFLSLQSESNLETCGENCNSEIYLINVDGSNLKRLTNNQRPDNNPVWQPKP